MVIVLQSLLQMLLSSFLVITVIEKMLKHMDNYS